MCNLYFIAFKPFGLEFQKWRCLCTEFANLIHFGRKNFFCRKTDGHSDRRKLHRRRRSNSSLDLTKIKIQHKLPIQRKISEIRQFDEKIVIVQSSDLTQRTNMKMKICKVMQTFPMRGAKMDCQDCQKYFQVLTYYTRYCFVKNGVIFLVRTFLISQYSTQLYLNF